MIRVIQLSELVVGIVATLALAYLVEERIHGRPVGVKDALKHGLRHWFHGVGTSIVAGVTIMGLLLLLIVPGIIWAVWRNSYALFFFRYQLWDLHMEFLNPFPEELKDMPLTSSYRDKLS